MATTAKARPYKQDLPPKGGYAPITFKRIPAQQIMKGKLNSTACSHAILLLKIQTVFDIVFIHLAILKLFFKFLFATCVISH